MDRIVPATGAEPVGAFTGSPAAYTFAAPVNGVYIPADGNLEVVMNGVARVFVGCKAGTVLPISPSAVRQANTTIPTPTNILGLLSQRT